MTLKELNRLLEATGYPVAYSHFPKAQNTPYITYLVTYSPNFHADNKTYHKINAVDIELYTDRKDESVEQVLETILDDNELAYDSDETYIESEKMFKKNYEVRLL